MPSTGTPRTELPPATRFLPSLKINDKLTMIIIDYTFWNYNGVEIDQWMDKNLENGWNTREGMVLSFENKEEMMWFLLRWGG